MKYAILVSTLFLLLVVAGQAPAKPPQSVIRANVPAQAPVAPPLGHHEVPYGLAVIKALETGQSVEVWVGTKAPPGLRSVNLMCWTPTLEGYNTGDVVVCRPYGGQMYFDHYKKGGPVTGPSSSQPYSSNTGGVMYYGDGQFGTVQGFGAFSSSGGNCAGGSCGSSSSQSMGLFRRR